MKAALCFVALALLVGSAAAAPLHTEEQYEFLFRSFITQFSKEYHHDEFHLRYSTFKDNLDMIKAHNEAGSSWTMNINEFADMTWDQFRSQKLGYSMISNDFIRSQNSRLLNETALPTSVNWVTAGAVTGIKDQGQCGSCWAFSTTGSIEGAVELSTGKLTSLSEQELVDCSTSYGNQGCNGGLMDYGFEYVIAKKGLCTEAAYAYKAVDGTCKATSCGAHVSPIKSYVDVTSNNEAQLQAAVAITPVSVAIEADQSGFQFYSSGVFDGTCGTALDHGVLAVGYDTDSSSGKPYWNVKNSWGVSWGQKGYIWLVRNTKAKTGQCGIAMQPSYPTV